jgi:hypothetical protein
MSRLRGLAAFVLALLAAGGMAAAEPLGAYPPGMSGGQIPLGAYPRSGPPPAPGPADPPAAPPVMTDTRAEYCARNPAVCNVREPGFDDYAIDRQKAFQQRMRDLELEIERGRSSRP